jgi:monoamine oxidase
MALLAPSLLTSCRTETNGIRVAVIGAGLAGLAAARQLHNAGYEVVVYEADSVIGGRIRTDRSTDIEFDLGASWIHGVNGNPIKTLADDAGAQSIESDFYDVACYRAGGVPVPLEEFMAKEEEFYAVINNLSASGAIGTGFEQVFLAQYPQYADDDLMRFFISSYLTFDTGDLDLLSSALYDEGEEYGGVERIIGNGYDRLINELASGIDVSLYSTAHGIDTSGVRPKVNVTPGPANSTGPMTAEFDHVIVTIPLGILKYGGITFCPSLPSTKLEAIQSIGFSSVEKFLFRWEATFWDDALFLAFAPAIPDRFNYFINMNRVKVGSNALMTFCYADEARASLSKSDGQLMDEVMAHLSEMYGISIPYPTMVIRSKWGQEQFIGGAYSYTAMGTSMHHFDDLAEPIGTKVFFAGEHTERDYFSTAHGAYLSGIREANRIIDLHI